MHRAKGDRFVCANGLPVCDNDKEKYAICHKDYRLQSCLSIQYVHGDLCKHVGIDSSTNRMIGIRSILEYISKCAGWPVPFLSATTKDRITRGSAYVSKSI